MKKAQDIAETTFGNAADQTRMATTLKRAAGMVRSAISEGVFDEKERKTLLDAITILERGVKIRRQAATLKSQKEEADAARRKEIGTHLAKTFGAIETISEKVAFVAAVERHKLSGGWMNTAEDLDRAFKEGLADLPYSLFRKEGSAAVVAKDAWAKFLEARERLEEQHAVMILKLSRA
ncbi:hypothetical protein [Paraburkholderia hospita]|uniref:hypothetical protein n=1 Tax=Paraburkholderia hospita TaxID=169430 RepID=UPI0008A7E506|nr:hypothetical protein [Paraburkholderia hospita]SEI14640.1 hypothetical protein SAMN05192544_102581 [Paraburkholderia hospita]